jgi:hypothetical protein
MRRWRTQGGGRSLERGRERGEGGASVQPLRHVRPFVACNPVQAILRPGLQPGAVDVFLDFISYSGGPREWQRGAWPD